MPKPKIKKEKQSPERSLSATPAKSRRAAAMVSTASPADGKRDVDTARLRPKYTPRPLPLRHYQDAELRSAASKIKIEQTDKKFLTTAPAADREAPAQRNRLVGPRHASGRQGAQAPPVASLLSSCPAPASKQPAVFIKTNPQYSFWAGINYPYLAQYLLNRNAPSSCTKAITRTANMDDFGFGSSNGLGGGQEMDFNALNTYVGAQDQMAPMVTLGQHQSLNNQVQGQGALIHQILDMNQKLINKVNQLEKRVGQLEQNNAPFHTLTSNANIGPQLALTANLDEVVANGNADGDGSPSPEDARLVKNARGKRHVGEAFTGEGVTMAGRTKYRKKLKLRISEGTTQGPGVSLLTPMLSAQQTAPPTALGSSFPTTPRTPYTPGRIGPPDSYKKTATSISKRDIHNLNKSMPPANVQLPMIPLTDTEVIVYFFNSLSKPSVSLRLYSRGWGPASIVQCLNDHRDVAPPYLRNTCSVKCTTALKLGRKLHGNDWEAETRATFANAEDSKATDLIRADENDTVDYFIRALGNSLKKHPAEEDGGIFTACVKYCIEHNASYTMSNVVQLAVDLRDGNVPQHPKSPLPADEAPVAQAARRRTENEESDAELTEDETPDPPSPLADRGSLGRIGGAVNLGLSKHADDAC